jgi:hypothetical protein
MESTDLEGNVSLQSYIQMHSAFTDKVERKCHFPAQKTNCCKVGKSILLFLWNDTYVTRIGKIL